MYTHLILLAKFDNVAIAYHFASQDSTAVIHQQATIQSQSPNPAAYSPHTLKTSDPNFASVVKMDPYFTNVTVYPDWQQFLTKLDKLVLLKAIDVAAFLLQHANLTAFGLQKMLYYIYADYLVTHQVPLFEANFVAFDKGPVERAVYHLQKYHHNRLQQNNNLDLKLMTGTLPVDTKKLLLAGIEKYASRFDTAWEDNQNPTHRDQTPWTLARQRGGQNEPIRNQDILHHHRIELI
ncbi:hypothetical protein FC99_GL000573 [Levilactobacillus koreensis JCM 16448]|uniref:Antitoxin SocA-like Panacea domain-containing protein n=1 Tax=Levilactobacillus koreensis TaxID=637971 RepID=A0AAC8UUT3_9LACO|nr:type II toxin-antitoxin system antitoxin SocA domain-containing protein [Levilactobacillus koreensis]AKP64346.1 hypothetical protein ABN16_04610 [Levilactobacillus koreensis]KRK88479.1 hypothetical protein FC99_GL000573 [Levilactobacillus koreensis JCM 16448]